MVQGADTLGRVVPVGGCQLRVLFTLLALGTGRVVPAASMAEQIWPDDPPGKPGSALQTLVSRLRAELGHAGLDQVTRPPGAVPATTAARPAGPARPPGGCGFRRLPEDPLPAPLPHPQPHPQRRSARQGADSRYREDFTVCPDGKAFVITENRFPVLAGKVRLRPGEGQLPCLGPDPPATTSCSLPANNYHTATPTGPRPVTHSPARPADAVVRAAGAGHRCEHLIEAAAALAHYVLANCPGMKIVATSRQSLRYRR